MHATVLILFRSLCLMITKAHVKFQPNPLVFERKWNRYTNRQTNTENYNIDARSHYHIVQMKQNGQEVCVKVYKVIFSESFSHQSNSIEFHFRKCNYVEIITTFKSKVYYLMLKVVFELSIKSIFDGEAFNTSLKDFICT